MLPILHITKNYKNVNSWWKFQFSRIIIFGIIRKNNVIEKEV